LIDVAVSFEAVDRSTTEQADVLAYELLIGNRGADLADSTILTVTPPQGVWITSWGFGAWTPNGSQDLEGSAVFGIGATPAPVCSLDAFVLRCEMGSVTNGWDIPLSIEMDVYEDPGELEANATVMAVGFDVDLDNNADTLAVASETSFAESIPDALAFTGLRLSLGSWILLATMLLGGGLLLRDFGRRRLASDR
jgi:hypothetical protein